MASKINVILTTINSGKTLQIRSDRSLRANIDKGIFLLGHDLIQIGDSSDSVQFGNGQNMKENLGMAGELTLSGIENLFKYLAIKTFMEVLCC